MCSEGFRHEVEAVFTPPPAPLPAIEQPMLHQNPRTAGPATRPPQLRSSSAFAPGTLRAAASLAPGLSPEQPPPFHSLYGPAAAGPGGSCAVSIDAGGPGGFAAAAAAVQPPAAQHMAAGGDPGATEGPLACGSRLWTAPSQQALPALVQPYGGGGAAAPPAGSGAAAGAGQGAVRSLGTMLEAVHQRTSSWFKGDPDFSSLDAPAPAPGQQLGGSDQLGWQEEAAAGAPTGLEAAVGKSAAPHLRDAAGSRGPPVPPPPRHLANSFSRSREWVP